MCSRTGCRSCLKSWASPTMSRCWPRVFGRYVRPIAVAPSLALAPHVTLCPIPRSTWFGPSTFRLVSSRPRCTRWWYCATSWPRSHRRRSCPRWPPQCATHAQARTTPTPTTYVLVFADGPPTLKPRCRCLCLCGLPHCPAMLQVFEGLVRMLKLRGDLSRSERRRLRALGMKVFLASYTHLPPPPGTTPEAKATAAAARRRKAVDPRLCRTARIEAAGVAMLAAVFPCEPDVWASIWAELGQRGSSSQCAFVARLSTHGLVVCAAAHCSRLEHC